jgi:hypothetical protein
MSYLANEQQYRQLISNYLHSEIDPEHFVDRFFEQWKADRDVQWEAVHAGQSVTAQEQSLCEVLDNIFAACDCFSSNPEVVGAITAGELHSEVRELAASRWQPIGT